MSQSRSTVRPTKSPLHPDVGTVGEVLCAGFADSVAPAFDLSRVLDTDMARSGRPRKIDPLKAIHGAVMNNDVSGFSVELAGGADIDAAGPEGMTPLHIAADRGNIEIAKAMLDCGAAIDPINVWGNTPLWVAIMKQGRPSFRFC